MRAVHHRQGVCDKPSDSQPVENVTGRANFRRDGFVARKSLTEDLDPLFLQF